MNAAALGIHYAKVRRVLLQVLLLNWLVAAAKLVLGYATSCASMSADGFHSFADGASNIIGLVGIALACQPKDKEHPYGHKKYETLFSLVIAAMLFFICWNLLLQGIHSLRDPKTPEVSSASFIVMAVTLLINIAVTRYEKARGTALKSDILLADAMHTRADILTSSAVIVAVIGISAGFPLIDPLATFLICGFIAKEAVAIFKKSSAVLCDTAIIVDEKMVSDVVLGITGVKACHNIRSRGRPDDIYIDLHVQVDSRMQVDKAHRICYAIEDALRSAIPEVSDVVVHIEPQD
jgi:cation diffusion facilitator family transporter